MSKSPQRYYLVDQVQDGQWEQVGHFVSRAGAERLQKLLPGRSRIIYGYPSFDRAPRLSPSRDLRKPEAHHARAWELWSLGEGYDEPFYIAAFADKGQAEERMRRLKRSNPHARYTLKHTQRVPTRGLYETGRRIRRAKAHHERTRG